MVATQVKSILDACVLFSNPSNRPDAYQSAPAGSPPCVVGQFELAGDTINLVPTVGLFITMNPGYAGEQWGHRGRATQAQRWRLFVLLCSSCWQAITNAPPSSHHPSLHTYAQCAAGRTELPENLKALFRSCAMIRPDLALICENM